MRNVTQLARALFLTALLVLGLAGVASAYDLEGVRLSADRKTATVTLTAEGDCTLTAGAYSAEGQLLELQSLPLTGQAGEQTRNVTLSTPLPEDGVVRAFLLSDDLRPLCARVTTDAPEAWDVYAILYNDGTLVF